MGRATLILYNGSLEVNYSLLQCAVNGLYYMINLRHVLLSVSDIYLRKIFLATNSSCLLLEGISLQ